MDIKSLTKFQRDTIERMYAVVDESVLLVGNTDLKVVSSEVRRLRRALEAELEAIEESVKEHHNL